VLVHDALFPRRHLHHAADVEEARSPSLDHAADVKSHDSPLETYYAGAPRTIRGSTFTLFASETRRRACDTTNHSDAHMSSFSSLTIYIEIRSTNVLTATTATGETAKVLLRAVA
jgi:hypothetical protein